MAKLKLVLFLLFPAFGFSQTGYEFNNGGSNVYIQKGALVTVQGNYINGNDTVSGLTVNDGILEVQGDFITKDNSVFTYSDPTSTDRVIKFTGTGTQNIKSSGDTASFYNLVVDKGSAGDVLQMQASVNVYGSLVFGTGTGTSTYTPSSLYTDSYNKGFIQTYTDSAEYVLSVKNGNTDAISGYPAMLINAAPTTGYILTSGLRGSAAGGIQRNITSTAGYDFPIGTSENGFNATRMNFAAIPSGGGLVTGKFNDGASNPDGFVGAVSQQCFGCTSANPSPDNTGYNRYFSSDPCNSNAPQWVTIQDGIQNHGYWSFASSGSDQSYQYSIETFPNSFTMLGSNTDTWRTLKYGAGYGFDPSDATVNWGQSIDSVSTLNDLLTYTLNTGDCYTGTGVPGGSYTGFGHFALKKGNSGNALPVELMYITAEAVNNKAIDVKWATALEVNNQGFEITRSINGSDFNDIGWMAGHNNSTSENDYLYSDNNVEPNIVYYYRFNQLDNNGNSKQSQIVSAKITGAGGISVSDPIPNPAIFASKINVTSSILQVMHLKLVDMLGQTLSEQIVDLNAGDNSISLDTRNLAAGDYSAILNAGDVYISKNLIIVK